MRNRLILPYQLGFDVATNQVLARGPKEVMDQVVQLPTARLHGAPGFNYATLPHSRETYLILEALGSPESATPEYITARKVAMSPPKELLTKLIAKLSELPMSPQSLSQLIAADHQLECIAHGINNRGLLNGSEQGTGKTLIGLTLAYLWRMKRVLVICPNSVCPEWSMQHDHWFDAEPTAKCPRFKVWTMTDVKVLERAVAFRLLKHEEGSHIAVVNYETVVRLEDAILDYAPDLVIIDESHQVKSPDAKVTKSVAVICSKAARVIAQSGTPIGNHVGDLWSQLKMVWPEFPVDYNTFKFYFANQEQVRGPGGKPMVVGGQALTKAVGSKNTGELMNVIAPLWYRATKATSIPDLLPKPPARNIKLALPRDVQDLYDAVKEDGEYALGRELGLSGQLVVGLRLQQIAGGTKACFTPDPTNELDYIKTLEEIKSPKLDWTLAWAKDNLLPHPDARAIVWCNFNAEVARVHRELGELLGKDRVTYANGSTTQEELTQMKQSFNSRDLEGVQVIVAQIDKVYSGHNLQACDYNIYYSNSWSYIKRAQSEDRSHRMGRQGVVQYFNLICRGTIDEELLAAIEAKKDLAIRLAPDTVSGVRNVSEEEVATFISNESLGKNRGKNVSA